MNHLDPGGLITVRLSVSDLSRAALRDGHMNLVVQKHQRGHLCLPVTWTPTSWRSTTFVLSMNSIGNSAEALGRQPRVWRSDYDVVIMKPNYVHIYLFSGGAISQLLSSAKMETFPNITRMKWSHRSFKFGIPAIEISTQLNCHQNSLSISYEH